MTARAFLRTPKGQLLLVFAPLVIAAVAAAGLASLGELAVATLVCAGMDAPILRLREGKWSVPSGAILTGLIIGMILSPHEPWHVVALVSVAAIGSKYVVRTSSANVFNPAALALLIAFFAFGAEESWWGALPDLPMIALGAVGAGGLYLAIRLHKLPAVIAFLFTYFAGFTVASYLTDPTRVWEVYRTPDLHAVVFLALFMVTDPPTSPPKAREQVTFGLISAAVTVATYFWGGGAYFLLTGVLAGNVWEAVRRVRQRQQREKARQHLGR